MTLTVHLVRHLPHIHQGRIQVGRMDGVPLADASQRRLPLLSKRFDDVELAAVYASPITRAQQTARAIADPPGLEVRTRPDLSELDVGDWTGQAFEALDGDERYAKWNGARPLARCPGGETMLEVQFRMVRWLEEVRLAHPNATIAAVSHGDPIKALILYLLGMPLDFYGRIDPQPGSRTTFEVNDWGAKLLTLNEILPE